MIEKLHDNISARIEIENSLDHHDMQESHLPLFDENLLWMQCFIFCEMFILEWQDTLWA